MSLLSEQQDEPIDHTFVIDQPCSQLGFCKFVWKQRVTTYQPHQTLVEQYQDMSTVYLIPQKSEPSIGYY